MLKEVKIEVTDLCYRNCKHCSTEATCDRTNALMLNSKVVKRIIDEAYEMGVESIVFTGGEATLYPSLIEVVKHAKSYGLKTKLYTMCFRTDDNLSLLQRLNDNGLDEIIYSTSFPLVINEDLSTYSLKEFIDLLVAKTNLFIGFHHVITNETITCINNIHQCIGAANEHLNNLSFLRYVPQGRGDNKLLPSKEQIIEFKRYLLNLKGKYGDKIRIGSPFNILNITNTPCNIAEDTMIIRADGNCYPCDAVKDFDYCGLGGNIYNQNLRDIYNSKYFNNVRNFRNYHGAECIKCSNYNICKSGCLGQKMIYATSLDGNKTMEWYELNAKRTMNNFETDDLMLTNVKTGIVGETGELIDDIKKFLTHNLSEEAKEALKLCMIDEIGDIIWYLAAPLSHYYKIPFNDMGNYLLNQSLSSYKLPNDNMIKYCASQKDPSCPFQTISTNNGHEINKIDSLINQDKRIINLEEFWETIFDNTYKLNKSLKSNNFIKEKIIILSAKLIMNLGLICHKCLDVNLEEVLKTNIMRLQVTYLTGFDAKIASKRIVKQSLYKINSDEFDYSYNKKKI